MTLLGLKRTRRHVLLSLALACIFVQGACTSVEHIRLYREARSDFSEAARNDNLKTLGDMFPDPEKLQAVYKERVRINYDDSLQRYEAWTAVHAEFAALNARASKELSKDRLLGSSKAMEILAKSRRDLYAQILEAGGREVQASADTLTESVAEAKELLSNKEIEFFPRDEYLLRSLRSIARYEIAYVNALRAFDSSGRIELKIAAPIAEQMAMAEDELAQALISESYPKNVQPHAAASRFIMLHTARFLLENCDGIGVLPLGQDDQNIRDHPGIERVSRRLQAFRAEAFKPNTPANNLVTALGLKPTFQNLTRIGLGEVIKSSP